MVFGKLVEAVGGAISKFQEWNTALRNEAMRLAEVSGSMANVMAESQVRQMMLDVKAGEATAESHRGREEAYSRYQQAAQPMDIAWTKMKNAVMEQIWGRIADAMEAMNRMMGANTQTQQTMGTAINLFEDIATGPQPFGDPLVP